MGAGGSEHFPAHPNTSVIITIMPIHSPKVSQNQNIGSCTVKCRISSTTEGIIHSRLNTRFSMNARKKLPLLDFFIITPEIKPKLTQCYYNIIKSSSQQFLVFCTEHTIPCITKSSLYGLALKMKKPKSKDPDFFCL